MTSSENAVPCRFTKPRYGSPSCIPATRITFHKGSNLDLLLYKTLVNQQCKALGLRLNPSSAHSSSICFCLMMSDKNWKSAKSPPAPSRVVSLSLITLDSCYSKLLDKFGKISWIRLNQAPISSISHSL